jgi:glucokinase
LLLYYSIYDIFVNANIGYTGNMNSHSYRLGVDVGGSHISCALIDSATCTLVHDRLLRADIHTHAESDVILAEFAEVIKRSAGDSLTATSTIGFAFPGPFDYEQGICLIPPELAKYEKLFGVNIKEELTRRLGFQGTMHFMNDAACFAIGEYRMGGARSSKRTLALAIGTGFGSTFLAEGKPVTQGSTVPEDGMLWHVPYNGGIADDTFSSRGLVRAWKEATGETIAGAKELEVLARAGDQRALAIFQNWGRQMAECLTPWLSACHVDTIVLGGNIAKAWDWFVPALKCGIGANIRVAPAELGESAQMIGAALIA